MVDPRHHAGTYKPIFPHCKTRVVLFPDKHIDLRFRYRVSIFNMGDNAEYITRHVDADLRFWRRRDVNNNVQANFARGKPEDNPTEMGVLAEMHKVHVQDIRGQESSYTLDKNGFVYLSHEMPELDKISDEEHIKDAIIQKTEELVRRMSVLISE